MVSNHPFIPKNLKNSVSPPAILHHRDGKPVPSIAELNELAEQIEGLADHDYEDLAAVLECESSMSIAEILEIIDQLDEFDFLTDVHTDEDLGYYYAEMCGTFDAVPAHLQSYIDMARYSYDLKLELNCCFTSYGVMIDNR